MIDWYFILNKDKYKDLESKLNAYIVKEPIEYPCWIFVHADFFENICFRMVYEKDLNKMLSKIKEGICRYN